MGQEFQNVDFFARPVEEVAPVFYSPVSTAREPVE
jgi:hypothetical protein